MEKFSPRIKIIGVGSPAVEMLGCLREDIPGRVELIAIDTDIEILNSSNISNKFHITLSNCRGICSPPPEILGKAARARTGEIRKFVEGADLVIIISYVGGVTGAGIAPVIADVCREMNVFTIGFVSTPFSFEGQRRYNRAKTGIIALKDLVNTLFHIPCDYLMRYFPPKTCLKDLFKFSIEFMSLGVRSLINPFIPPTCMDFADIRMLFIDGWIGGMAVGSSRWENRAADAITDARGEKNLFLGEENLFLPLIDAGRIWWFDIEGRSNLLIYEIEKIKLAVHDLAKS